MENLKWPTVPSLIGQKITAINLMSWKVERKSFVLTQMLLNKLSQFFF